jgi:hypothetical protein
VTRQVEVDPVLAAYRSVHGPDADASARMWESLSRRAAAGEVVALADEPAVVPSRAKLWLFAGVAAAALLGIGWSIGAVRVAEDRAESFEQTVDQAVAPAPQETASAQETAARTSRVVPAAAPPAAVLPAPEIAVAPIEPAPRVRAPKARPAAAKDVEASVDAAEILELRAAQRLLARDPAAALAKLDAHATAYPRSTLAAERSVARITALCNAGRVDASREAAEDFAAAHPGSPLVARVQGVCSDVAKVETESPGGGMR